LVIGYWNQQPTANNQQPSEGDWLWVIGHWLLVIGYWNQQPTANNQQPSEGDWLWVIGHW
jgi:hypothetical protein